jgi:hypothetical protein
VSHAWANALVAALAAVALYAGARLLREALRRPVLLVEDLALAAAWAFVLGGLVWLRAHLTGSALLGFGEPWTWLTASHFGAAGYGALTVTALVTRMVEGERARRLFIALLVAHPIAFACTAAGIAGVRVLDQIGAPIYLAIFLAQAVAWTVAAAPAGPRAVRMALVLALWLPVATMVPAVAWAWGVQVWDLGEMIRYHGGANAAGHVGLGLGTLALLRVPRRAPPLDAPLSHLRSRGRVEPGFLDAHRTIRRSVRGLTDDLASFGRPDFDASELHPTVVDFYERTAEFEIDASGRWHAPFRIAGWVWARAVSPALGQLGLPAPGRSLDGSELESRIFEIDDAVDGRSGVATEPAHALRRGVRGARSRRRPLHEHRLSPALGKPHLDPPPLAGGRTRPRADEPPSEELRGRPGRLPGRRGKAVAPAHRRDHHRAPRERQGRAARQPRDVALRTALPDDLVPHPARALIGTPLMGWPPMARTVPAGPPVIP